jgi:GTP-binding protein HflX
LERQKGGIGLRGPGETQLETDRRLLQDRIKQLLKRIDKVRQQRALGRQSRKKSDVPTVVIIGYTNAGKSTLFNQMTRADVYAEDRLFATLDATLRSVHLPGAGKIILADTVGFIRHIPHDLVVAFRSTLEETTEASLLIHLVDASDPWRDDKIHEVEKVIAEVGASAVPQLIVFNKIDKLEPVMAPKVDLDEQGQPLRVWLSAKQDQGLPLLYDALAAYFKGRFVNARLVLAVGAGQQRAKLYELGKVRAEHFDDLGQACIDLTLTQQQWQQIQTWPEMVHTELL